MNSLKYFISELYRKRRSIFMSVVIAFIAWIVTIICTDRYSVVTLTNVPVVANLANTQTEQLGLDVVKVSPDKVSVKLKGPRYKLALYSKDDLAVTPISFKNMTRDGDYELELKADLKQAQSDVSVEAIDPNSAIFSVDVITTKLVDVNCNMANVQAEEGFVVDSPICQPKNLYVSGPKKFVDCLESIQLDVGSSQKVLNSTKTFDAQPKFVAANGAELSRSAFKYNEAVKFDVTFPIYRQKQVPLTFMFKNAPSCFNSALLKYSITPDVISLGLSSEVASGLKELNVGYVDMRQLDFNSNFNFNVVVPAGFKNLSQVETVNVSFDTSEWAQKFFSIDDIRLINPNENYDVKIKSSVLEKVKIVGLKDFVNNINKADVTATVDLSSIKLKPGEQNVQVNIGILNKKGAWPVGSYSCTVNCKKNG